VTESALVTQQGIAMALGQARPAGRHRKKSNAAASWTMSRQNKTSHAAARSTTPRHRKASPAPASRTTPRHRKGRGNGQAIYPSLGISQGNSIRAATRRVALPGALAVGLFAIGGAITGAFSAPFPGAERADGSGPGALPALTAESKPSSEVSVTLPPMADGGVQAPIDASGPAWPISEQAATDVGNGDGGSGELAQNATTTTVRDRVPEPGAFAPSVTAEPSGGHSGGGGPAESSMPPEPPVVGGGALPGVLGPGGLLDGLDGKQGADRGDGRNSGDGNTSPGSEGPGHPGRVDRAGGGPRNTSSREGAGRGFGSPGKASDAGSPGHGGNDGQPGGGGHGRRGASGR
jgi:hypothetical protein